jgi:hypothetical protein
MRILRVVSSVFGYGVKKIGLKKIIGIKRSVENLINVNKKTCFLCFFNVFLMFF